MQLPKLALINTGLPAMSTFRYPGVQKYSQCPLASSPSSSLNPATRAVLPAHSLGPLFLADVNPTADNIIELASLPKPVEPLLDASHDLAEIGMADAVQLVVLGMQDPRLAVGVGLARTPDAHDRAMLVDDSPFLGLGPNDHVEEPARLAVGVQTLESRPAFAQLLLVDHRRGDVALRGLAMLVRPGTSDGVFVVLGGQEFGRQFESLAKLDHVQVSEVAFEKLGNGDLRAFLFLLLARKLEPENVDDLLPRQGRDLARDLPDVFEPRRMGRPRKDDIGMVAVVKLGADLVRDRGKESLVVWLVAPRPPDWWNVLAKENEMASAAGPMPGDLGECRLAGDELVNALPLVRLAVEVDDIKLARRANADVVATLRLEELRDVALLGVVVPPCLDGRLFAGIGFCRTKGRLRDKPAS